MNYIQTLAQLAENTTENLQLYDMKSLLNRALKEKILSLSKGREIYKRAQTRKKHTSKLTLYRLRDKREKVHKVICENIEASYLPHHLTGVERLIENGILLGVVSPSEYNQIQYLYKQKQRVMREEV